jgi:hypothetical protein
MDRTVAKEAGDAPIRTKGGLRHKKNIVVEQTKALSFTEKELTLIRACEEGNIDEVTKS